MCDTLVTTGKATNDGCVILAKNSDREANEVQILSYYPGKTYKEGEECKCTYISIPQIKQTYQILISRPFWMWGCEMGVNEYGVGIGNEAVFTKEPVEKNGLLGMDIIRICLERSKNAYDALILATELIEKYGQGGNGGYKHSLFYHNSFIFADTTDAYVLETANKHWVAIKVDGVRSISNGLTIEEDYNFSSKGIEDYARKKDYIQKGENFNFKKAFSDKFYTFFSKCKTRHERSMNLLDIYKGSIIPKTMMKILRDHGDKEKKPSETDMGSICMHASLFPTRPSQSVSSMVAHLKKDMTTIWATGSSATCTSSFIPFYLKNGENIDFSYFPSFENRKYDEKNYWWIHEKLHRQAIFKWDYFTKEILPEIDEFENKLIDKDIKLYSEKANFNSFVSLSKEAVKQSIEKHKIWINKISHASKSKIDPSFSLFWKNLNKKENIKF